MDEKISGRHDKPSRNGPLTGRKRENCNPVCLTSSFVLYKIRCLYRANNIPHLDLVKWLQWMRFANCRAWKMVIGYISSENHALFDVHYFRNTRRNMSPTKFSAHVRLESIDWKRSHLHFLPTAIFFSNVASFEHTDRRVIVLNITSYVFGSCIKGIRLPLKYES